MYQLVSSKVIIFFITLFSIFSISTAQWSFKLSTDQEYNDNPFRTQLATKTFLSSVDFGLENHIGDFSVGYYGSYLNFDVVPERNFYWHQIAAWKDYENSALGIYAEQGLNKDIYTYYDYSNITAYYRHQFSLKDFHFTLSPNLSLTKYKNISIMDNYKGSLGLNINHGFESGTTLITGGSFNYKKYLNPVQSGTYTYLDENNTLITDTYIDKNVSSITQLVSFGRIAQSITPTTGLAVQFTNRSILNGFGAFVKDLNMIYGDESEMFDDPVNYEGNNLSVELTQIFFDDLELKSGLYLNQKHYPSQGIYDVLYNYDTGVMRNDTQNIFNFSIKKSIPLGFLNDTNLSIGLNYQLIDNKSNSVPFNYKNNSLSLNLGFQF
ncbi:MAG: hypothetical protein NTX65_09025 [Ignavibacteriales bacterium]|nr:hypothetical protein [Ignavibacteriales bacterium]